MSREVALADSGPACPVEDWGTLADEDLPDGAALAAAAAGQEKLRVLPEVPEAISVLDISLNPADRVVLPISCVPQEFQPLFSEFPYFNALQSQLLPHLLQQDNSVAVCAPTGSGKTALFELAILRVLMQHRKFQTVSPCSSSRAAD